MYVNTFYYNYIYLNAVCHYVCALSLLPEKVTHNFLSQISSGLPFRDQIWPYFLSIDAHINSLIISS